MPTVLKAVFRDLEHPNLNPVNPKQVFIAVEKAIMSYYDLSYRYKYEALQLCPKEPGV